MFMGQVKGRDHIIIPASIWFISYDITNSIFYRKYFLEKTFMKSFEQNSPKGTPGQRQMQG